jgi:transcriptional regulator with XRE-family HTH domain
VLTGAQIRAARGMLNLSVTELAEMSGLAINTIRRAEGSNGIPAITPANLKLLSMTFDEAGLIFIDADKHGVGVRFAHPHAAEYKNRRRDVT